MTPKPRTSIDNFENLLGVTLSAVERYDAELIFVLMDGRRYHLYHSQECCESVYIEDVVGELDDLIDSPLLRAEEVSNSDDPPVPGSEYSYIWTFYKLATVKGAVTIRWFGSSNGYYSESVDFGEM